jgi:hypothetical protein
MKNTNKYKLNIKTMKKGLLTLLAASLVFVGCQNYDDQFDDLNAQISALKSQVDGLAALSGQVASLSSTISGLQAGVTAAQNAASAIDLSGLEASLASLSSEVDAIQADLATAATAADVTALQADLAAVQADLDEILASANIYQDNVAIASVNDLDTFEDLGSNINIVNGNVTITRSAAMNTTTLQAVIDNIFTINGNLLVTDVAGTATNSFDNLTSVQNITMDNVDGAVSFAALTTAEVIDIDESEGDHDSDTTTANAGMMTSLSMPLLASATSIDLGAANTINLEDSGTSVNINSLGQFGTQAGGQTGLTVHVKTGGSLTAAALTSPLDAAGDETFALTLKGMASVTVPAGVTGGTLTVSEVPSLTVNGFQGTVDVNTGVTTLVASATAVDLAGADDLITATITGQAQTAAHDDYLAANVPAEGDGLGNVSVVADNADLTDLTVAGTVGTVTVNAAPSIASVTISATMSDLTLVGNVDLTSVNVSDASIQDIHIDNNDDLDTLVLDNASNLAYTGSATANTGTALDVDNNADLASLTVSINTLDDLDIDTNANLSTLDFSGVTAIGTTAAPDFDITGNDLDAASIVETDNSADTGTINAGTSGMGTLSAMITAIAADTDATATIRFDSAQSITAEAGEINNGNDVNYGDNNDDLLDVFLKTGGTAAGAGAVTEGTQTTAVGVTHNAADADLIIALNGVTIDMGDTVANNATNLTTVLAQANVDSALAAGGVLTAKRGYNSSISVTVSLITPAGSTAIFGERYTTTAAMTAAAANTTAAQQAEFGLGGADEFTLTVGSESVTVSFANDAATTPQAIVDAWDANWPKDSVVTISQTGETAAAQLYAFDIIAVATALDSSAYNLPVSISVSDSTTASSHTSAALEYIIGDTRATDDNSTDDSGIIVQFTSTAAGATNNSIVSIAAGAGNGAVLDVLTAAESPADGSTGVDGVAGSAGTTGVSVNHVGWIS